MMQRPFSLQLTLCAKRASRSPPRREQLAGGGRTQHPACLASTPCSHARRSPRRRAGADVGQAQRAIADASQQQVLKATAHLGQSSASPAPGEFRTSPGRRGPPARDRLPRARHRPHALGQPGRLLHARGRWRLAAAPLHHHRGSLGLLPQRRRRARGRAVLPQPPGEP
jgi:hypothetical protein